MTASPATANNRGAEASNRPNELLTRATSAAPIVAPIPTARVRRGVWPPGTAWPVATRIVMAMRPIRSPIRTDHGEEPDATHAPSASTRKRAPMPPDLSSDSRRVTV